ncbi:GT4 family glycosyltransferase PelF [Posidoniimonas corsicana]|uniref:GT4 family glycosyltransferase PelF n=1 Tax=Posidoniimonas corsicana TaxID=1938618 RepID=UPI001E59836F|nr:GT4 family glycosyltransferase PelF [Posidoniimonas corsicana]
MQIGFVMHTMQVAGAEVLVAEMARRLAPSIEATIICLDELGRLGALLQDEGIDVIALGRRPGIDLRMPGLISRIVRERGLRILHAHQYTPFFYAALAKLRGAKAKVIFTEHGRHYPDVVSWKRRWANRLLLSRFSDLTTACCQFAAEAVEKKDGFASRSVRVVPNGIDLNEFSALAVPQDLARQRLGLDPDLLYLSMVARFHPVKDHETLVRAFDKVSKAEPSARLLLVGEGPERQRIDSLVAEFGLSDRVEFTGVRSDVAAILSASDLFVLSSVSEAASLTLLEAMACGTPVVVTDVGGNPEIVRYGQDGLLIPRGDSGRMANAIIQLLRDPERRREMGVAARRRVAEEYDLAISLQRYVALYEQVLGRHA